MQIKSFVFSPFQENTYLIYDENGQGIIVDPGCAEAHEKQALKSFIEENNIQVQLLLQTHCHIDHIFGNAWVYQTYGLSARMHQADLPWMENAEQAAARWGLQVEAPEIPQDQFLEHGEIITLGQMKWEVRYTPGHAPGHVVFVNHEAGVIIAGDTLFRESIGRTDLPLCKHEDLIESIQKQLFSLPDHYRVLSGHGPETTIGHEKQFNPFL